MNEFNEFIEFDEQLWKNSNVLFGEVLSTICLGWRWVLPGQVQSREGEVEVVSQSFAQHLTQGIIILHPS